MPVNDAIRKKRAAGLYGIDTKNKIRSAEDSKIVETLYKDFFVDERNVHMICHSHFKKKKKEVYPAKLIKQ